MQAPLISRVENGRSGLSLEHLRDAAAALGVSIGSLVEDVPDIGAPEDGEIVTLWRRLDPARRDLLLTVAHAIERLGRQSRD